MAVMLRSEVAGRVRMGRHRQLADSRSAGGALGQAGSPCDGPTADVKEDTPCSALVGSWPGIKDSRP